MAGGNLGPEYDLAVRIQKLEDQVRDLSTRDVLRNASIGKDGLVVNGGGSITLTGGGAILVNDSGEIVVSGSGGVAITGGGYLQVVGGGQALVDGLPLSSISPKVFNFFASNFPVGVSETTVVSGTIPVPTGYTRALVYMTVAGEFQNGSAGLAFARIRGSVTAPGGGSFTTALYSITIPAGQVQSMSVPGSGFITGITAGSITVSGLVIAGADFGTNIYNAAGLAGQIIFIA